MNTVAHLSTARPSNPVHLCICGRPARKPRLKSPISIAAAYYPGRWTAAMLRKARVGRLGFSTTQLTAVEWSEVLDEASGINDVERTRRHGKNASERRARLKMVRSKLESLMGGLRPSTTEPLDAAAE